MLSLEPTYILCLELKTYFQDWVKLNSLQPLDLMSGYHHIALDKNALSHPLANMST